MLFLKHALADPAFMALRQRLESVIEHNIPTEALISAKSRMQRSAAALAGHIGHCLDIDSDSAQNLLLALGALLLGASQMDASPPVDRRTLPPDVRDMVNSLSCEAVFLPNALLLLEGIRRRTTRPQNVG